MGAQENPSLMWLQAGSCSGDSMSLLCAEDPDFVEFIERNKVDLLWHPSLSVEPTSHLAQQIDDICNDEKELSILCVEGSIMMGPNGTGMFDAWRGKPKKDIIHALAQKATHVIAIGTCASYGGVHASNPNPTDCTGLQYHKGAMGGLLPMDWQARGGYPVINVSGCPAHPHTMVQVIQALLRGNELALNDVNQPELYFNAMVHQGCTRNEYHEYDIEETEFGQEGCLFFNMGCQGPVTHATCNTELWNKTSSKTRAGVPCIGCVEPTFPRDKALFKTEKIGDIPVELPLGVKRPRYMAYKGLAKAAAPDRVASRKMKP
ncbi:Cytochrome-c3 hydrogenase [Candidatus Terasakiella magnetica]|uniref:hydrogenase (acceptor) n=1 Tax=Candidatus Terasakiella magnetica TaxID=1867952 RepID=A0A1C3RLZ9_9PROT|nr:NADH:ubiquinone oxidoreductase [Candidatus Terasakiella magnetica]SCA58258.1 Cytochrome-c3 hydrogenase [Candidatus Terasakiella magnetica]